MLWQLIRKDRVWTLVKWWTLLLAAAFCALPRAGKFDFATSFGMQFVLMAFLGTLPHQRASRFDVALPVAARDLLLARSLSILLGIWSLALVEVGTTLLLAGFTVAVKQTLSVACAASLCTGVLQLVYIGRPEAPRWLLIPAFAAAISGAMFLSLFANPAEMAACDL